MGLYASAPTSPDPKETAAAQTSTNVATAVANSWLGNVNQITPDGSLTYSQTGQNFVNDPNGQKYWYNAGTGKYSTSAPQGGGGSTTKVQGNGQPKYITNDRGVQVPNPAYKETTVSTPGNSTKGWEQVTGYYIPTFTATQTLSPQQLKIKENEDKASQHLSRIAREQSWNMADFLNKGINTSKLPNSYNWSSLKTPEYQTVGSGPSSLQKEIKGAGKIQTSLGNAGDVTSTYGTDFSKDRQKVEDALMARMNPQLAQDRAALESRLVNQGLQPGSEAYNRAIDEARRAANDARYGAILAGGEEQSRLANLERDRAMFQNSAQQQTFDQLLSRGTFGNAAQSQQYGQNANNAQFSNSVKQQIYDNRLKGAGFNNTVADQRFNATIAKGTQQDNSRQRALQEAFALRNQPINEITSLMSGAQVNAPQFMNIQGASIPTVDYAGLVQSNYANEMAGYNAQQQAIGGLFGGIGNVLGSLKLSDDTTKKNKKKLGKAKGAMNLWEFNYKGEPEGTPAHVGLMASEVQREKPSAVKRKNGLRFVDYGKALAS